MNTNIQENIKELQQLLQEGNYQRVISTSRSLLKDNKNDTNILNALDFGVPQSRKRVIIIGVENNSPINIEDIYAEIKSRYVDNIKTFKDAVGKYPKIYPIDSSSNRRISHSIKRGSVKISDHVPRYHNKRDIEIFKKWISQDMNRKSNKEKIDFYFEHVGKQTNHGKYRNFEWDKPSNTIVAHLHKDGLLFIHPDPAQARTITVREAATLQSFDEDFILSGSAGTDYKLIGNAVPPLMAKEIAKTILKYIK